MRILHTDNTKGTKNATFDREKYLLTLEDGTEVEKDIICGPFKKIFSNKDSQSTTTFCAVCYGDIIIGSDVDIIGDESKVKKIKYDTTLLDKLIYPAFKRSVVGYPYLLNENVLTANNLSNFTAIAQAGTKLYFVIWSSADFYPKTSTIKSNTNTCVKVTQKNLKTIKTDLFNMGVEKMYLDSSICDNIWEVTVLSGNNLVFINNEDGTSNETFIQIYGL